MKAAVLNQKNYSFEILDVPVPSPDENEVLVRLKAAALNHHELWMLKERKTRSAHNIIPGADGAGEIVETGKGVNDQLPGKAVVINPGLYWGGSPRVQGPDFEILGFPTPGTFAEYVKVPAENIFEMPAHFSFKEAAALPLSALTAWRILFTRGQLQRSDKILITGIGGGVATYCLLFAIKAGAKVWVTSGSNEKIRTAVQIGAENGVNYRLPDWSEELLTGAGGFDIIADGSAGDNFSELVELCNPGARIVLYGRTSGMINTINPKTLFWKQISILGSSMGSPAEFRQMINFVQVHEILPVIDSTIALENINDGFKRLGMTSQTGKIIIRT